jgi:hypothetical protein
MDGTQWQAVLEYKGEKLIKHGRGILIWKKIYKKQRNLVGIMV